MTLTELQARRDSALRIAECCRMRAALELIRVLVAGARSAANRARIQDVIQRALDTPANDAALRVVAAGLAADALAHPT